MDLFEEFRYIYDYNNITYDDIVNESRKCEDIQKGDILFDVGGFNNFADISWEQNFGLSTAYESYILGYKNGADILVDFSLLTLKEGRLDIIDTFIFPILFMYRQFFELSLKKLYIIYSQENDNIKYNNIKEASHNLMKMWTLVEVELNYYEYNEERISIARDYIKQVNDFDYSSFEYRYPINKKGEYIEYNIPRVDIGNLKNKVDRFNNFMINVEYYIQTKI